MEKVDSWRQLDILVLVGLSVGVVIYYSLLWDKGLNGMDEGVGLYRSNEFWRGKSRTGTLLAW